MKKGTNTAHTNRCAFEGCRQHCFPPMISKEIYKLLNFRGQNCFAARVSYGPLYTLIALNLVCASLGIGTGVWAFRNRYAKNVSMLLRSLGVTSNPWATKPQELYNIETFFAYRFRKAQTPIPMPRLAHTRLRAIRVTVGAGIGVGRVPTQDSEPAAESFQFIINPEHGANFAHKWTQPEPARDQGTSNIWKSDIARC